MAEFKEGDIVYHKSTGRKGLILGPPVQAWPVAWKEDNRSLHTEMELLTEKEHHKQSEPSIASADF